MTVSLAFLCVFVLTVVATVFGIKGGTSWHSSFFRDWEKAARAAGLEVQPPSSDVSRALGKLDGVAVYAQLKLVQSKASHYAFWISAQSATPPRSLTVRLKSTLKAITGFGRDGEPTIGDPALDAQVELPSPDAIACAALSHPARAHLSRLLGWGGSIRDGAVVCEVIWTDKDHASMAPLVRNAVALAQLISVPPAELAQRLAYNALEDTAPGVRLNSLRHLFAPETNAPAELTASIAQALLHDVHVPVRLLAAEHIGEPGHDVLRAVADDTTLELTLRADAVRGFGRSTLPDLVALRAVLLECPLPELVIAALSVVGAAHGSRLLEAVQHQARSEYEGVRAAAARALGALASPEAEPLLIELLADAAPEVQQQSAEALGSMGSVAAVEPLLPLSQSLLSPRLRQLARDAIGRIQSRLGDVEAGRLSLSAPLELAGAVDIVDASQARPRGALSLADAEASRPGGRSASGVGSTDAEGAPSAPAASPAVQSHAAQRDPSKR